MFARINIRYTNINETKARKQLIAIVTSLATSVRMVDKMSVVKVDVKSKTNIAQNVTLLRRICLITSSFGWLFKIAYLLSHASTILTGRYVMRSKYGLSL